MKLFLRRLLWFIQNRCEYCGGELEEYNWKNVFCVTCGKKN